MEDINGIFRRERVVKERERERVVKEMRRIIADSAVSWQMGFQDPATPVAKGIMEFHHDLMLVMLFVVIFVSWIMGRIVYEYRKTEKHTIADGVVHGTVIEIVWTMIPAVTLMMIAVPSFALLYSVDEVVDPGMTVKVVGHQWYWTYEYSDIEGEEEEGIELESYMLPEEELTTGELRLLEVDNRMVLPIETNIRWIITAADVLHSFTIPSFGVKLDACPGRLNQASLYIDRPGVYYGQCSELCGIQHAFMPIVVEGVSMEDYLVWLKGKME